MYTRLHITYRHFVTDFKIFEILQITEEILKIQGFVLTAFAIFTTPLDVLTL